MKILTKSAANSAIIASLFTPGGTLACLPKERFDLGKYKRNLAGEDVPAHMIPHVHLVWCESRRDSEGPYFVLRSIAKPATRTGAKPSLL